MSSESITLNDLSRSPGKSNASSASGSKSSPNHEYLMRRNNEWTSGLTHIGDICAVADGLNLRDNVVGRSSRSSTPCDVFTVFLPDVSKIMENEDPENLSSDLKNLSRHFQIPNLFWSKIAQEASGFVGCEETRDDNGALNRHSSHFRFLIKTPDRAEAPFMHDIHTAYKWHKLGYCTTWTPQATTLLCFGGTMDLQKLQENLTKTSLNDPFAIHTVVAEDIVSRYDTSTWAWRDSIRDLEKSRAEPLEIDPDYVMMHELARHVIHASETLSMAIEIISSMLQEHQIFLDENAELASASKFQSSQIRKVFRRQKSLLTCVKSRSEALGQRLKNEINLAFNTVAQYDNRVTVQISRAMQADSAAMRTISILGLAFLPGTFVCALFSTTFFAFSPGSDTEPAAWLVSDKFWIYWATAIPVTLVTIAFWALWQRKFAKVGLYLRHTAHEQHRQ